MSGIEQDIEKKLLGLLDDPEFIELTKDEARFNVFDALGVRRQELRNSDFLSYILDPSRPHGLGDKVLRSFLLHSVQSGRGNEFLDPIELRLSSLDRVLVERERHRVDIIVENPGEWVVLIENKIDAGEGENQLARYKGLVSEKYGALPFLLIYLTPNGDEPSEDGWLPISHRIVCDIVRSMTSDELVPSRIFYVLQDYVEYMESYVLEDTRIAEMCRRIYKKHRESIDLIIQHIPNPQEASVEAAKEVMQRLSKRDIVKQDSPYRRIPRGVDVRSYGLIPFVPGSSWTSGGKGVLYEWEVTSKNLRIDLVVGPINDDLKIKVINGLEGLDAQLYSSASMGSKYAHIAKEQVLRFDDIDEFMSQDQFESMVSELEEKVKSVMDVHSKNLQKVLGGLQGN